MTVRKVYIKKGVDIQAPTDLRAIKSCFPLSCEGVRSEVALSFDSDMSLRLLVAWVTHPLIVYVIARFLNLSSPMQTLLQQTNIIRTSTFFVAKIEKRA